MRSDSLKPAYFLNGPSAIRSLPVVPEFLSLRTAQGVQGARKLSIRVTTIRLKPWLSVHSLVSLFIADVIWETPITALARWVMTDGKSAPQNIQDAFLNTIRREKIAVTIYLLSGAKLLGKIRSFDKFSVLLESSAQDQLIFKHAISTITVGRRGSGELRNHSDGPPLE